MRQLLAIIVIGCTPLCSPAAVIDMRERVTVDAGALVRLKDVARIVDGDPIKATALGEITLGPAPAAGRSQRLNFDELRNRLQIHGVNLTDIEFRGQVTTTITAPSAAPATTVPATPPPRAVRVEPVKAAKVAPAPTKLQQQQAEQLLQTAVQRVFRLMASEKFPVRVTCRCDPRDVLLVLATDAERIRFAESQIQIGGPQTVTAHWQATDDSLQSVVVQVVAELAPRRLAVRHPIPAGYPLQADDLEWIPSDPDSLALTNPADAVGKETKLAMRAGQPLTADMLATIPLIKTNDIVTVQVRRRGVSVRRMFKALGTGSLHDIVSLVAVDDPRLRVQGVVTGYHEATIVEQSSAPTAVGTTGGQR
jgi:flagella basal body P-ring formation protein FlgA